MRYLHFLFVLPLNNSELKLNFTSQEIRNFITEGFGCKTDISTLAGIVKDYMTTNKVSLDSLASSSNATATVSLKVAPLK